MTVNPKFRKTITFFKQKIVPTHPIYNVPNPLAGTALGAIFQQSERFAHLTPIIARSELSKVRINQSLCRIYLILEVNHYRNIKCFLRLKVKYKK